MTGFIVSGFPFRNRVSSTEAFEGLELGEGKLSRPVLRGPGGRKAAWLLGSNANVADGGIRESTRSPIIRPWPLPPLRPKRAASGVAGLRYGSGQRKTNHALMSETSAGKPQPEAIPL